MREKIYWGERVLKEKSMIFLSKHARPKKTLWAIFERSEKEPVNI
ncbi:MAG: hypothetical protein U5L45_16490 [Saprospiraceae bacterium]|nr:hypothetical protein [Saprospiraceae bacterium]